MNTHLPGTTSIAEPLNTAVAVLYFHTDLNVFPPNYRNMAANYRGRPESEIKENLYGWSENVKQRAWPLFSSVNVIDPEKIPAKGINWMVADPAGARNYACIWGRVPPGEPMELYIYREWPDLEHYGAWATPNANPEDVDGEPGPAQRSLGYGVAEYKRLWRSLERGTSNIEQRTSNIEPEKPEEIFCRLIDPRAGRDAHLAEQGARCIIDDFAETTPGADGAPMRFLPARGLDIREGVAAVNKLLYWDREQPLQRLVNAPRLFVSKRCGNVIWTMQNYSGERGPERGACKDFADCLRYLTTIGIERYRGGPPEVTGGGSY